jgi:hypothetical protein
MPINRDGAVERAKTDLAGRLSVEEDDIAVARLEDREFPDASLGAPLAGEMSAQMISSGWEIVLEADGQAFEYRGDKYQLRLHDFEGSNFLLDIE